MNRREHHKQQVIWERHCKVRSRYIDRRVSETGENRKDIEDAILWVLHEKGAYMPSYRQYKKQNITPSVFKKRFYKIVKNFEKEKSRMSEYGNFLKKLGVNPEEMRRDMASRLRRCDMCKHNDERPFVACAECDIKTKSKWEYRE